MHGFWPRLSPAEWITFALLAAGLAVTNIYTTLLTGWGDGGSIIAVIASAMMLGAIGRKAITTDALNLGQTMASAGGSVGFSVCAYAAVRMVDPTFAPSQPVMMASFVAMGILGAVVGGSVRKQMIGYFFPSGTACAVIQRTVTAHGDEARRPVRMLQIWGGLSALLTIPTKIARAEGGSAMVHSLKYPGDSVLGLSFEPLLYGIGIVVGPRIGLGMMIGAVSIPWLIAPALQANGMEAELGDWAKWMAIAVLTIPTFAAIGFAYLFHTPPIIPDGFTPGAREHEVPPNRTPVLVLLGVIGVTGTLWTCSVLFGLPWWVGLLTVALSWPLCIMNGRVTGDTDINPVRLVAIAVLTLFAWLVTTGGDVDKTQAAVVLLGMAIIGGTLAGMAVDMMQDFRTGYLVDANPHHQTTVQVLGSVIGALVAVPFIIYLEGQMGFGEGTPLAAPGAQIWSAMAEAFAGGSQLSQALIVAAIIVSVVFSALTFLTVWPVTARYMPSLFGIGIGMLLPFEMCSAIFVGGLLKMGVTMWYAHKGADDPRRAATAAGEDTMLVGSSVFAASAVVSVLVVLAAKLPFIHLAH